MVAIVDATRKTRSGKPLSNEPAPKKRRITNPKVQGYVPMEPKNLSAYDLYRWYLGKKDQCNYRLSSGQIQLDVVNEATMLLKIPKTEATTKLIRNWITKVLERKQRLIGFKKHGSPEEIERSLDNEFGNEIILHWRDVDQINNFIDGDINATTHELNFTSGDLNVTSGHFDNHSVDDTASNEVSVVNNNNFDDDDDYVPVDTESETDGESNVSGDGNEHLLIARDNFD